MNIPGLPTVGTLRRSHPFGRFVPDGWVGHNALFGSVALWPRRIVGTFRLRWACGVATVKVGWVADGRDASAIPSVKVSGICGLVDYFTGWSGYTWLDTSFGTLRQFGLDECDKCLDKLNMRKDVQQFFIVAPEKEQVMLFSAPLTSET